MAISFEHVPMIVMMPTLCALLHAVITYKLIEADLYSFKMALSDFTMITTLAVYVWTYVEALKNPPLRYRLNFYLYYLTFFYLAFAQYRFFQQSCAVSFTQLSDLLSPNGILLLASLFEVIVLFTHLLVSFHPMSFKPIFSHLD